MTAAETGQLLLSSLHTTGAANTIDRIIDAFPPNQQAQIRLQLSMVLQAVISQQLVPGVEDGTPIPVFEIMYSTLAIRNMIRESKTHQLDAADVYKRQVLSLGLLKAAKALREEQNAQDVYKRQSSNREEASESDAPERSSIARLLQNTLSCS